MDRCGLKHVGVCLRSSLPVRTSVALARRAEDAGFHSVWVTEGTGAKDAVTQMAAIACGASRIQVASGIIPIWTRTPIMLGSTAVGLDELSDGRLILGLGFGHRPLLRSQIAIDMQSRPQWQKMPTATICYRNIVYRRRAVAYHEGLNGRCLYVRQSLLHFSGNSQKVATWQVCGISNLIEGEKTS